MPIDLAEKIAALPPLRDIVTQFELRTRKSLGQHFLLDLNVTRKIVSLAGDLKGVTVFEVGPGPGGLTRPLLASDAKQVIVLEKDDRCLPLLQDLQKLAGDALKIAMDDALSVDLERMASAPRAIVANLPYNVGTLMLLAWLKNMDAFVSLTLMFQKEVADRLVATPNSKAYGRLSILTQFCCKAEKVMDLPARAFSPPPKVDSAVVHLVPRKDRPNDISFEALEKVTAAAFGQRRKMLRSSLKPLGGEELLAKAGIAGTLRAEDLTLAQFETLARLSAAK